MILSTSYFFLIVLFMHTVFMNSAQAQCAVPECPVGKQCLTTAVQTYACVASVPYNSSWQERTLQVLTASLNAGYGFLELMHNTGPPYEIELVIPQFHTTATLSNTLYVSDANSHTFCLSLSPPYVGLFATSTKPRI